MADKKPTFIVNNKLIFDALTFLNKYVPKNPTIPMLENVLVVLGNDQVILTVYNLATGIRIRVPAQIRYEHIGASMALPFDKLYGYFKTYQQGDKKYSDVNTTITFDLDTYSAELRTYNGDNKISGEDAFDFPKVPFEDLAHSSDKAVLNVPELVKALEKTKAALIGIKDKYRENCFGILIEKDRISLAVAQSGLITVNSVPADISGIVEEVGLSEDKVEFILDTCKKVLTNEKGNDNLEVKMYSHSEKVLFHFDSARKHGAIEVYLKGSDCKVLKDDEALGAVENDEVLVDIEIKYDSLKKDLATMWNAISIISFDIPKESSNPVYLKGYEGERMKNPSVEISLFLDVVYNSDTIAYGNFVIDRKQFEKIAASFGKEGDIRLAFTRNGKVKISSAKNPNDFAYFNALSLNRNYDYKYIDETKGNPVAEAKKKWREYRKSEKNTTFISDGYGLPKLCYFLPAYTKGSEKDCLLGKGYYFSDVTEVRALLEGKEEEAPKKAYLMYKNISENSDVGAYIGFFHGLLEDSQFNYLYKFGTNKKEELEQLYGENDGRVLIETIISIQQEMQKKYRVSCEDMAEEFALAKFDAVALRSGNKDGFRVDLVNIFDESQIEWVNDNFTPSQELREYVDLKVNYLKNMAKNYNLDVFKGFAKDFAEEGSHFFGLILKEIGLPENKKVTEEELYYALRGEQMPAKEPEALPEEQEEVSEFDIKKAYLNPTKRTNWADLETGDYVIMPFKDEHGKDVLQGFVESIGAMPAPRGSIMVEIEAKNGTFVKTTTKELKSNRGYYLKPQNKPQKQEPTPTTPNSEWEARKAMLNPTKRNNWAEVKVGDYVVFLDGSGGFVVDLFSGGVKIDKGQESFVYYLTDLKKQKAYYLQPQKQEPTPKPAIKEVREKAGKTDAPQSRENINVGDKVETIYFTSDLPIGTVGEVVKIWNDGKYDWAKLYFGKNQSGQKLHKSILMDAIKLISSPETAGKEKEAWEMTLREYGEEREELEKVGGKLTETQIEALNNDLSHPYVYSHGKLYGDNKSGRYGGLVRFKSHKKAVKKALSEGKPVPAHVLAEYPELAPPTPTGKTAAPKEAWEMTLKEWQIDVLQKEREQIKNYIQENPNKYWGSRSWKYKVSKKEDGGAENALLLVENVLGILLETGKIDKKYLKDLDKRISFESLMRNHKTYINRALSEGKPVPANVLAEYPELASTGKKKEPTVSNWEFKGFVTAIVEGNYDAKTLKYMLDTIDKHNINLFSVVRLYSLNEINTYIPYLTDVKRQPFLVDLSKEERGLINDIGKYFMLAMKEKMLAKSRATNILKLSPDQKRKYFNLKTDKNMSLALLKKIEKADLKGLPAQYKKEIEQFKDDLKNYREADMSDSEIVELETSQIPDGEKETFDSLYAMSDMLDGTFAQSQPKDTAKAKSSDTENEREYLEKKIEAFKIALEFAEGDEVTYLEEKIEAFEIALEFV